MEFIICHVTVIILFTVCVFFKINKMSLSVNLFLYKVICTGCLGFVFFVDVIYFSFLSFKH